MTSNAATFKIMAAFWSAALLCIFSVAIAATSFGYQPAGILNGGYTEIADKNAVFKIVAVLAIGARMKRSWVRQRRNPLQ